MEELNGQSWQGGVIGNQRGFTLIELIVVIVILGIMAAVAAPQYANMQLQARNSAARGVFGGASGAASINFAAGIVGAVQPAGGPITNGTTLVAALDAGLPNGWGTDDVGGAGLVGICAAATPCDVTTAPYSVIITAVEVAGTSRAALAAGGTVAGW